MTSYGLSTKLVSRRRVQVITEDIINRSHPQIEAVCFLKKILIQATASIREHTVCDFMMLVEVV